MNSIKIIMSWVVV